MLTNKSFRQQLQSQQYVSHDYKTPSCNNKPLPYFDLKKDLFPSDLKNDYLHKFEIQSKLISPSISIK